MSKKASNPSPPKEAVKPTPPPAPPKGPPCRTYGGIGGIFGQYETKESIRAREDYETYIKAYMEGLAAGRHKA